MNVDDEIGHHTNKNQRGRGRKRGDQLSAMSKTWREKEREKESKLEILIERKRVKCGYLRHDIADGRSTFGDEWEDILRTYTDFTTSLSLVFTVTPNRMDTHTPSEIPRVRRREECGEFGGEERGEEKCLPSLSAFSIQKVFFDSTEIHLIRT
jgi:hypothetical protein